MVTKVFNLLIAHKGYVYTALLSFSEKQDADLAIKVHTHEEKIEIILSNGRLIFSIPEIIKQLIKTKKNSGEGRLYITENISMQLLSISGSDV